MSIWKGSLKLNINIDMNNDNRKEIIRAIELLEEAKHILSDQSQEEENKFDNLTEGLQAAESGQKLSDNSEALSTAESDVESIIDTLNDLIQ